MKNISVGKIQQQNINEQAYFTRPKKNATYVNSVVVSYVYAKDMTFEGSKLL